MNDVNALHTAFAAGLKQHYGKRLRSGIPRIGNINTLSKDQRFNMLDPDGNRLIVIQIRTETSRKPKQHTVDESDQQGSARRLFA